jgi:hypothetical protein
MKLLPSTTTRSKNKLWRRDTGTYQTGQVIPCFTLQLLGISKSVNKPTLAVNLFIVISNILSTHSTFDNRCSGFAFSTTKIRIGTKESAPSSLFRCRISPACMTNGENMQPRHSERQTKDDLAAIQNANKFIAWCLVVIDLDEFWIPLSMNHQRHERGKQGKPC